MKRRLGKGRTRSRLPARSVRSRAPLALAHPTTRTAQGAAVPCCQDIPHSNEKSQVSQLRHLTFLAGTEELGLCCRSGRLIACVPLARIRPSARGFGVDVETEHQRAGKGLCCPVFQNKPRQRGAVLVLRGKLEKRNYQLP